MIMKKILGPLILTVLITLTIVALSSIDAAASKM
jgi:hypothetical protein